MGKRINANYEIIRAIPVNDREIVLGENKNLQVSPYVTWISNGKDYYWGHYFSTYDAAIIDFCTRVYDECKYLSNQLEKTLSRKGAK